MIHPADSPADDDRPEPIDRAPGCANRDECLVHGTFAEGVAWHSLLAFLAAEPGSPLVELSPGVYVVQKSGEPDRFDM